MTRRDLFRMAALAAAPSGPPRVSIPMHRIVDARDPCTPAELRRFWWTIWPESVRDFGRARIEFQTTDGPGEVRRTAADRPFFIGLRRGAVNLVLTRHIPLYWDNARALPGVTTIHDGYHVCMLALPYAHANRIPFVSVNTCTHELLHALLQDVFVSRPKWYQSGSREFRVDWFATRLWLSGDGAAVRESAAHYVRRLQAVTGTVQQA